MAGALETVTLQLEKCQLSVFSFSMPLSLAPTSENEGSATWRFTGFRVSEEKEELTAGLLSLNFIWLTLPALSSSAILTLPSANFKKAFANGSRSPGAKLLCHHPRQTDRKTDRQTTGMCVTVEFP